MVKAQSSKSTNDMTIGSPLRAIIKFAIPLILGYILQQMYLIIDAAIVGRWIGVGALAAVGASSSIMFLIMGFCNGSCAGFAIPIAQAFGARDYAKMRAYVSNSLRIAVVFAVVITFLSCIFCEKILHLVNTPKEVFDDAYIFLMLRIREHLVTREISIGDYVLTGGELAACIIADSVVRIIPGAIGDEASALTDSFQDNLLAPPVYTRPAEFRGWRVPDVLLSGNFAQIARWQDEQSLERTRQLRPDLLGE